MKKEKTNLGYVIAYKKYTRNKYKEYYLYLEKYHVYKTDYIIEATVFKTENEAKQEIVKLDNKALYVKSYDIEVFRYEK